MAASAVTLPVSFELGRAVEVLERTPGVLCQLLSGLNRQWTHGDYGQDTFCPYDVIGHLIHGERCDWMARTRIILEHGPDRPFDRYDRYAMFEESRGKSLDDLLAEFEQLRQESLTALRDLNLTPEKLALRGKHPALGEVTLSQLLATWVAHDMNHLAQIAKAMATQYQDAVGPWRQYLGILKTPPTPMDAEGAERKRRANAGQS